MLKRFHQLQANIKGTCLWLFRAIFISLVPVTTVSANSLDLMSLSLEELMQIKVSVSSRTESRQEFQPASTTVIYREEIENSSARTLNDLLNQYVPGYFKAEDKDDTIAAFRGIAPDNNSKVLLLIDGINVNADWFWGPADSILNGIDLNYIERVEIIRGPGSVTLGQGAQLGVINVITRNAPNDSEFLVSLGDKNWQQLAIHGSHQVQSHQFHWYLSKQSLDGFPMAARGWGIEVVESDSFHPAPASLRGNRLNRNDALRVILNYKNDPFAVTLQHHRQTRDLYNWTKDRDQVEQRLTLISANYQKQFTESLYGQFSFGWQQDDYALYDHTFDITTGGARETRFNSQFNITWHSTDKRTRWINGIEFLRFKTGDANWQDDNFIVNQISDVNPLNNQRNTWVFDNTTNSRAFFSELSTAISEQFDINLGARLDDHPNWDLRFSPRISLIFQRDRTAPIFRLSYSLGFRGAPGVHYSGGFLRDGLLSESNFDELDGTGMTSSTTGELLMSLPDTKPEKLSLYEIGVKGNINQEWLYDLVYFYSNVEDIIVTESTRNGIPESPVGTDIVGTWGGVFYYTNAPGNLVIDGIEISTRYRTKNLEHAFSYSKSRVLEADGFEFGLKSPVAGSPNSIHSNGIPEEFIRYQGTWQFAPKWAFAYQHLFLGDWYSPWSNELAKGIDWGNLTLRWQPLPLHQLSLKLKNIWSESGLYPIRERGRNNNTPGTPSLEPRSIQLSYQIQF